MNRRILSRSYAISTAVGKRGSEGNFDLIGQGRRSHRVVEADRDRQKPLGSKPGKKTGLQERRLAEPRLSEEHGQILAGNPPDQIVGLCHAAMEKVAPPLRECDQPRPGILGVNADVGRIADWLSSFIRVELLDRFSYEPLTILLKSSKNAAVTQPPGSHVICRASKHSGTAVSFRVSSTTTGTMNARP